MEYYDKKIFITGIAGFIGFHLAKTLQQLGCEVVGCDTFNDYYDPRLKRERSRILSLGGIKVAEMDICDREGLATLFQSQKTTHLIHLAAQAGVRYSITHPETYQQINSNGFFHLLETLRHFRDIRLIFASSSSVYGLNKKIPFSEIDPTDQPANFYGATKKSNELMAFSYHNLFGLSAVGLRFFTVYGPFGRPDMAYYSFSDAIQKGRTISLFNHGNMRRDFTYIDDIVSGIIGAIDLKTGFDIFNLGNNHPEPLSKLIQLIEDFFGKKAAIELLPMPKGEIEITFADTRKAEKMLGFSPQTSLENGMESFLNWFASRNLYKGAISGIE